MRERNSNPCGRIAKARKPGGEPLDARLDLGEAREGEVDLDAVGLDKLSRPNVESTYPTNSREIQTYCTALLFIALYKQRINRIAARNMSNSAETFDSWPREELRLLIGFGITAFAIIFLGFFFRQAALTPLARLIVCVLGFTSLVLGVSIVLFRRLVIIDPVRRKALRVILLHRFVIHRRLWPLEHFQLIYLRQRVDEGTRSVTVGLRSSCGTEVWLRSFESPLCGLSEEATDFVKHLEELTGLPSEDEAS